METIKIKVYGRVQGVFFRANTKRFCDDNGLNGKVRNMSDGTVEIFVQGTEEKIRSLIEYLKSSPGISKVDKIEVRKTKLKKFESFEIIREGNFFTYKKKALANLGRKLANN